jgi:hypothetical protein
MNLFSLEKGKEISVFRQTKRFSPFSGKPIIFLPSKPRRALDLTMCANINSAKKWIQFPAKGVNQIMFYKFCKGLCTHYDTNLDETLYALFQSNLHKTSSFRLWMDTLCNSAQNKACEKIVKL